MAVSLPGEANLKEQIVPRRTSKCGFAHKRTHPFPLDCSAMNWDVQHKTTRKTKMES